MPAELVERDSTARLTVQTAQAVRGLDASRVEDAIAHLAAARPLSPPVSLRRSALSTSAQTYRTRIARPDIPHYVLVHGVLTSDAEVSVDLSVTTDTDATARTGTVFLGSEDVSDIQTRGVSFALVASIGGAAAVDISGTNYEGVELEATASSASPTVYLASWGAVVLPIYEPWASPEVTT